VAEGVARVARDRLLVERGRGVLAANFSIAPEQELRKAEMSQRVGAEGARLVRCSLVKHGQQRRHEIRERAPRPRAPLAHGRHRELELRASDRQARMRGGELLERLPAAAGVAR
jgi:hypothetical protein